MPKTRSSPSLSRRNIIKGMGVAVGWTAASWQRVAGANDRVGVALVGCGNRGRPLMKGLLGPGSAEIRAVCDVWDERRAQARTELAAAPGILDTPAIEDVLARADVDAVMVATPDHLHLKLALMAIKARKHLYLEKPVIHRFEEGEVLARAAAGTDRVVMGGTQQRSGAHYLRAKEEIFDRGRLGDVVFARAIWADFPRQRRTLPAAPKPDGLDWKRFLGNAAQVPYTPARYETWRYFPEYGGGLLADILTHWVDVAQWMMNDAEPQRAVALGGQYKFNDGRRNPDTVNALIKYKRWNLMFESTVLQVKHPRPSVIFEGSLGTLDIGRDSYTFTPNEGATEIVKAEGDLDKAHTASFVAAVTGKKTASPNIATALQACRPVQMALASYWSGLPMQLSTNGKKIVPARGTQT